jgi:aspartate/methionine/tyrosine aminotransferase
MSVAPRRTLIDLSLGDPHYGPPPEARVAATQAILRQSSGYLPEAGLPQLRRALAEKLRDENGIDASDDEVVVTTGASLGILAVASAVTRPGDRVLIPRPGFPLYGLMARTIGLEVALYPLVENGLFEPDWEALDDLAPRARLLVWNFPSNPTGAVARPEWAGRLRAILDRNPRMLVLSDEVYEDIVFEGEHVGAAALAGELRHRCLSVFSFSKGLGMAGMRVGYVHVPGSLGPAVAQRQWSAAMSAPTPAQWAALGALRAAGTYRDQVMTLLRSNRAIAHARLCELGLRCAAAPAGFFMWADIASLGLTAAGFVAACERECGVRIAPGTLFDPSADGRVRLSFAVPTDDLIDALDRIGALIGRRYVAGEVDPVYSS